ncbi:uncharacterized protein LOC126828867 [Patella vulgata]|uniref:uncharacterized protein LOC126828867 n=1 Tax=Patella vulgata TaxID=6465 RepID=UPI00217F3992|nr:uncharacterized protein LOC126828867 [Patella vulgata]
MEATSFTVRKNKKTLPFSYNIVHACTCYFLCCLNFELLNTVITTRIINIDTFNLENSFHRKYGVITTSSWFNNGGHPIKEDNETVTAVVPVGEILTIYLNVAAVEEMDIYYTVNDAPPLKTPSRFRCSRLKLFQRSWAYIYLEPFNKIIKIKKDHFKMKLCPSPDGYGTYKFFIRRQVFNKALNKSETNEFQYSTVFDVLADKSQIFDNMFFTVSTINNGPLKLNESTAGHILAETRFLWIIDLIVTVAIGFVAFVMALLKSNIISLLLFAYYQLPEPRNTHFSSVIVYHTGVVYCEYKITKFQILIIAVFPNLLRQYVTNITLRECLLYIGIAYVFYFIFLNHVLTFMCYELVPCDNRESEALGGIPPSDQIVKVYDIYISYSDRDILFVKEEILPVLQKIGLRVFFRHHDVLPGKLILTECENAICSSKAFIAVVTDRYLKDYSRNNFELSLLKNVLNKSDIPDSNLLIMIFPTCAWNEHIFDKHTIIAIASDTVLHDDEKYEIGLWLKQIDDDFNVLAIEHG